MDSFPLFLGGFLLLKEAHVASVVAPILAHASEPAGSWPGNTGANLGDDLPCGKLS